MHPQARGTRKDAHGTCDAHASCLTRASTRSRRRRRRYRRSRRHARVACRHCQKKRRRRWRRRGLCSVCYNLPGVRAQYPRRGTDAYDLMMGFDFLAHAGPCPGPVPGEPGSEERIAELCKRYAMRADLWPGLAVGGKEARMPPLPLLAGLAAMAG